MNLNVLWKNYSKLGNCSQLLAITDVGCLIPRNPCLISFFVDSECYRVLFGVWRGGGGGGGLLLC